MEGVLCFRAKKASASYLTIKTKRGQHGSTLVVRRKRFYLPLSCAELQREMGNSTSGGAAAALSSATVTHWVLLRYKVVSRDSFWEYNYVFQSQKGLLQQVSLVFMACGCWCLQIYLQSQASFTDVDQWESIELSSTLTSPTFAKSCRQAPWLRTDVLHQNISGLRTIVTPLESC